jgi:hypothetical protein
MRCGAFGSWHCGHRPVVAARSESCVRRFAVRVLECLRFGLGIVSRQSPVVDLRSADLRSATCFNPLSGASRGSSNPIAHEHVPVLRFVPHCGQSPAQSSRHNGFIGSAR